MSTTHRLTVQAGPRPEGAPLDLGDADGVRDGIRVMTRYLTRGDEPWMPVMGEYHFSRDHPDRWERELRKIAAGGVTVLATYTLWIAHEEVRGRVRWDGSRDLRRFIETAARVGLKVLLRIGPWAHGETRNGGFPDWVQRLDIGHRSDDPAYLTLARNWYAQIAEQVRGLFHTEDDPGAPIIGIQIDNELYDNAEHLATLRALAEREGMRATLWTATGWGGAELPTGRVLPVYAGYSDGFWEEAETGWPAFGASHFAFDTVRDDLTVGADVRGGDAADIAPGGGGVDDPWPFVTCELGGGMTVAYHRRPLVDPDDVAALALTKIGSGSAWQGYYMYHGGTHALGELSTLQESHSTAYPNDVPVRDYDFFAPVGAAGVQRPHFHSLRQQHLMLQSFADALAPAAVTIPPRGADSAESPSPRLRWSVRSDGARGFLFVNNHQPHAASLPAVRDVRFEVEMAHTVVSVPSVGTAIDRPIDIAAGAYFVWPLRQRFGSLPAVTVTAQPVTEITHDGRCVVIFAATDGVDVEVQFEGVEASGIRGARVHVHDDVVTARPLAAPGLGCEVTVGDTTLVFLDSATARGVWRGGVDGRDTVVVWCGEGWFDGGFRAVLAAKPQAIAAFPSLQQAQSASTAVDGTVFGRYSLPAAPPDVRFAPPRFDSAPLAPVRRGGSADRLSAPTDEDFALAARAELVVPAHALVGEEAVLVIEWVGDALRLYIGDDLLIDQFWSGRALEIDLVPHRAALADHPLVLRAFAWAPGSGVHVDPRVRPQSEQPVLKVDSVTIHPRATALVC